MLPKNPISKRHRERQFYDPATAGTLYYARTCWRGGRDSKSSYIERLCC